MYKQISIVSNKTKYFTEHGTRKKVFLFYLQTFLIERLFSCQNYYKRKHYENKIEKILRKSTTYIIVIVTVCGTFLTNSTSVSASELVLNEPNEYSYTGISPHLRYAITHKPIYVMKMDGKQVFCVESGIFTTTGGGYIPESYIAPKKDILSKITYYVYVVTQLMIWEE